MKWGSAMKRQAPDRGAPLLQRARLFGLGSWEETRRVGAILRTETVGGLLLVGATMIAVTVANSPLDSLYEAVRAFRVGPAALGLELSLEAWASDGLLALFFFLVGLELKREFVAGDLRDPRRAMVPILAAAGGVAVPALIYAAINLRSPETIHGWAIPTATDIAFAVAVLAIVGSHLPSALRTFLLTLAVVDDLITIGIMAVAYSGHIDWLVLLATAAAVGLFGFLAHRLQGLWVRYPWATVVILLPVGAVAWVLMFHSGVHATIAGVALGLTVPVHPHRSAADERGLAGTLEHQLRPLSAGFAVPVFALLATGVHLGGWQGLVAAASDPVTFGIVTARLVGKPVGILATTWLVTKITRAALDESVAWIDLLGVGLLGGIGLTVPLLVAQLSFESRALTDDARVGILAACVLAALLAAAVLVPRNRHYRQIERAETVDADGDGVPDAFQRDPS